MQALSRLTSLEVLQLDKHDDPEGGDGGGAPAAFSIPPESMVLLAQGWSESLHTLDLYNVTPAEMPEAVRGCDAFAARTNRVWRETAGWLRTTQACHESSQPRNLAPRRPCAC